jgi:prevent-host-death family protein
MEDATTKRYSIADARHRLPALLREVEQGCTVEVTRRGKPVAIVLSLAQYERLAKPHGGFREAYQRWRSGVDWEDWDDSIVDQLLAERDRSSGREFRWPD